MTRQFMFFATVQDLTLVLSDVEQRKALQYTLKGLFKTAAPQTHSSYARIPDFGRTYHPQAAASPAYLVAEQGALVHVETVPQLAGGVRFAIGQPLNQDTVVLRPGGRYGTDALLYGTIGTASDSVVSNSLYDFMVAPYRARFKKVHEFFLGAEAFNLWKAGVRMTTAASSPPKFDLKP